MTDDQLVLRNDQVRELLTRMPSWLVRRGNQALFLLALVLLVLAAVVRYPDTLTAPVVVTTRRLPIEVKLPGRNAGNPEIQRLLVGNFERVRAGQVLVLLDNTASYEDIRAAKRSLADFARTQVPDFAPSLQLGRISGQYAELLLLAEKQRVYQQGRFFSGTLTELESELAALSRLHDNIGGQLAVASEKLRLDSRQFGRDSLLFATRVISASQYETARKAFLTVQLENQQLAARRLETEQRMAEMRKLMAASRRDSLLTRNELESGLANAARQLEAAIRQWENENTLVSPIDGVVNFSQPLEERKPVLPNKELMVIRPAQSGLIAYAYLPSDRVGKTQIGQRARLYLDAYPNQEYGVVEGTVSGIAGVAVNGEYYVTFRMPAQLVTNYGKRLTFTQNMRGQVRIITRNRSLLFRTLDQARKLANRQ